MWRACPQTPTMSQSQRNHNDNDDKTHSPENSRSEHTTQLTRGSDYVMKNIRKELDKVKNSMKGKTTTNLDGMIKRTDSPFTTSVLELPLPPKFPSSLIGGL